MSNPFLDPPSDPAGPGDAPPCILCGSHRRTKVFEKQGYDFLRCGECSLVRLEPVPDEKTLAQVYESSYDDGAYRTFADAHQIRLAHAEARLDIVAPHASEGPWLDVGCSTGAFLDAASRRGIDIDGLDVSASAVETARGRGLNAFHAAAESFEPERRYAYITGFDVLEHVVDPGAFLDRIHGWLAPRGRIALTVPDIKSIHARLMGRHWYYYSPPLHITYFDRATATKMMESHGFYPIAIANAPKVMTIDYVTSQLATFNPWLYRAVSAVSGLVPATLRSRALPISTGEILVVASA